jgi:aspartate-semialdehyde dehydrogenase
MREKLRVGILGATGMVGQHYVRLLQNHPWFEVSYLAASREWKSYREALGEKECCSAAMPVHSIDEIEATSAACDFVFSALGTDAALEYERQYAAAGLPVVSNASAHRLDPDVPVLIGEVNPEHLAMIPKQQKNRGWEKGFIVVKPNCSLQSYLFPLFPLHRAFEIKRLIVTTMQAVSGAGYPGVASLDILDNIIPYIGGEEEKSETEPLKILGRMEQGRFVHAAGIEISAHCNRVPVADGHTACVSVEFVQKPSREEILRLWREFRGAPQELQLPSAPLRPIVYREEKDRPQPKLDRNAENGMAITVGRLRDCPVLDYRFVALSHNALRGAARGGILNAELLLRQNYL